MPKSAVSHVVWSQERGIYVLYERSNPNIPLRQGDDERWFIWLTSHTSFSFQGKDGSCNLQKERRARGGEGYWYAFRRQGKRVVKKYAGRTSDLSIAHLEHLAQHLNTSMSSIS